MSFTESAPAAMVTAVAFANNHTGDEGPPNPTDPVTGQRDLYTQLIISLGLGVTACLSFCVCRCLAVSQLCAQKPRLTIYRRDSFYGRNGRNYTRLGGDSTIRI